jgi:salicylate hydroxylase
VAGATPVVIVGGGIGGLTLALALARRGMSARVLERAPALAEIGAGLQLSPNACRLLDRLSLGAALDAVSIEPDRLRMYDGRSGGLVVTLPLGAARRRWGAPYRLLHRADLQSVLREAVAAAGVEIGLGQEVTGFVPQEDGVTADTAAGVPIAGRVLIGADGLGSSVRRALGDARPPAPSGMTGWRALIPAANWPVAIARDEVALWLGAGGHLVAYPLRGGGVLNLVACIPETRGDADEDNLRRFFATWGPAARAIVAAGEGWTPWPLLDRPSGHFPGRGRVAVIGDAAHPALPHLAQGAAMAIEDAVLLAARLAEMPDDPPAALRRFERARTSRVARVQREARRNGRIYALGPLPAAARNLALRAMGPDAVLGRLDWLYGFGA